LFDRLLVAGGEAADRFGLSHFFAGPAGIAGTGKPDRFLQQLADRCSRSRFGWNSRWECANGSDRRAKEERRCKGAKLMGNHL
jgi:hypothetical protein